MLFAVAAVAAFAICWAWSTSSAFASKGRAGGYMPVEIVQLTGNNSSGSSNSYRITLNGTTDVDQPVSIFVTSAGVYTNMPSSATVLAGQSSVDVTATVSSNPPAAWRIVAACNGTAAMSPEYSPPPASE